MPDVAAVTRIEITAVDSTASAVASATAGLEKIGTTATAATAAFQSLAGALGVGFSIAGITAYAQSVVSMAEDLHNLSVVTGSSVEQLSELSNAAKISGVGIETFTTLLERMTSNMETLSPTSTKAQQALQYLGVSAKDPATALQQVAVALDQYADGAGKAAAARDLFGRGGPEITAALHAMATATTDLTTTTTADAEAAAHLSEQIRTLEVQATSFKDAILRDAVPALSAWITGIQSARSFGLTWWQSIDVGSVSMDKLAARLVDEKTKLDALAQSYNKAATSWNAYQAGQNYVNPAASGFAQQQKVVAALQAQIDQLDQSGKNALAKMAGIDDIGKKQLDYSTPQANTALQSLTTSLVDQYAALTNNATEVEKWKAALAGAKGTLDPLIDSLADVKGKTAIFTQGLKDASDQLTSYKAADDKIASEGTAFTDSLVTQNKALSDSVATFGMSSDAAKIWTTQQELAAASANGNEYAVKLLTQQLDLLQQTAANNGVAEAAKQAEDAWKSAATSIDHDLSGMFADLIFNGKSAFQNVADYAKQLFEKLVLQPVLAPVASGVASLLVPGAAGASGASGAIGNSLGLGSSLFGAGSSLDSLLGGTSLTGGSVLGSTIGLLAPYVGVAAALGALASAVIPKGGGPKSGGFASIGDTVLPSDAGPGGRYFTPSDADSQLQTLVQGLNTSYASALQALGGTGAAGFALGYDTDPKGTAGGRVGVGVQVGGQTAFAQVTGGLGNDSASITAALTAASQEALLAALQKSDLPADIAKILNSVNAATATSDQVTNIIAYASAVKQFNEAVSGNALADALKAVAAAADPAYSALESQRQALVALGDAYQGTTDQTTALATASQSYYQSLVTELATIENMKTSIAKSGQDLKNSLTLSTLDTSGQYAFYQSDAASAEAKLASAATPTDAQALQQQILKDIQSAFGLLTPDQQSAQLGQFTSSIDRIDAEATAKLNDLETAIKKNADDTQAQLAASVAQFADAVNTFADAAGTPVQAVVVAPASTPSANPSRRTNFPG
jgi:hypothetical protein